MKFLMVLAFVSPLFAQAAGHEYTLLHDSRAPKGVHHLAAKKAPQVNGASFASMESASVTAQCRGTRCRSNDMMNVTIVFKLSGCADDLGEVSSKLDVESNKLYVSAINLKNPDSTRMMCIRQPTQEIQFTVGGANEQTTVVNVGE